MDHQRDAGASSKGEGELEALVVHRWEVLGARVDEEALEADHARVEQRLHRTEARRCHPAPEPDVDTELSFGGMPLGGQGVGVDGGRDTVDGHVDQGRDAARQLLPPWRWRTPPRRCCPARTHARGCRQGRGARRRRHRSSISSAGRGGRIDGEQRRDGPVPHADGPGPLPTARNDPLGADQQVQRAVVQAATMYREERSPQGGRCR